MLVASLGGLTAASTTLLVLCALGVIGWFVTDAGIHGAPRDGLRVAGLGWLAAHGAGVHVRGTAITLLPLGITAMCAWVTWRVGYRVGDSVSGHGPDAQDISNGERDWTVPIAATLFTAAYVVVVAITGVLAALRSDGAVRAGGDHRSGTSFDRLRRMPASRSARDGPPSGLRRVPLMLRVALAGARRIVVAYLVVSFVVLAVSLILNFSTAATIASRLQADGGDTALFVLATLFVLPNAIIFSGSYLLGPGFALGVKTVVSPALVVLGPLPLFPLLAAVPRSGDGSSLTRDLWLSLPFWWRPGRWRATTVTIRPPSGWTGSSAEALPGCSPAFAFALLASLAGGAIGPGRMRHVSPFVFDVLVHAHCLLRHRRAAGRGGHDLVDPSGPGVPPVGRRTGATSSARYTARRVARLPLEPHAEASRGDGFGLRHQPPGACWMPALDPAYGASVVAVGADREDIEGLRRAERAGIPTFVRKVSQFETRDGWDRAVSDIVGRFDPDLIVLAGFHEARRAGVPRRLRWPHRQHPPCALRRRFPGCTDRPKRSRTA